MESRDWGVLVLYLSAMEYFHPETGEGLGGESFTWTAALAVDLLTTRGFE